jgi:hypothetical protein
LSPEAFLLAAVAKRGFLSAIPAEHTDVRVHWIVSPDRAVRTSFSGFPHAAVHWDALSPRRIRRNGALFYIHHSFRKQMP